MEHYRITDRRTLLEWEIIMINFEEELKKFHPTLEVEDVEDAIYNQDVTDLADVLVKLVKDAKEE